MTNDMFLDANGDNSNQDDDLLEDNPIEVLFDELEDTESLIAFLSLIF